MKIKFSGNGSDIDLANSAASASSELRGEAEEMAPKSDKDTWMIDAVRQFLKSPEYTVAVLNFIDEHCIVFDDSEEHQLEHSELHKQYTDLVFGLLEKCLKDIGVELEHFSRVAQEAVARGGDDGHVLNQIMTVDDFVAFKRMMANQNRAIQLETLREMQRQQQREAEFAQAQGRTNNGTRGNVDLEAEERAQLERALALSRESQSAQEGREESDLQEAMRLSELESQQARAAIQKFADMVPSEMNEEQMLAAAMEASLKHAQPKPPPPPGSPPSGAAVAGAASGGAALSERGAIEGVVAVARVEMISVPPITAPPAGAPLVTDSDLEKAILQQELAAKEHELAVQKALAVVAGDDPDSSRDESDSPMRQKASLASADSVAAAAAPAPAGGALPPISAPKSGALPAIGGSSRGMASATSVELSSMSVEDMQRAEAKKKKRAEKERLRAEKAALEIRLGEVKQEQLSEVEIAKRKQHLEEQRAKIIEMKRKEREQALQSVAASRPSGPVRQGSSLKQVGSDVLAAVSSLTTTKPAEDTGVENQHPCVNAPGASAEDVKRSEMRRALAMQLKEQI